MFFLASTAEWKDANCKFFIVVNVLVMSNVDYDPVQSLAALQRLSQGSQSGSEAGLPIHESTRVSEQDPGAGEEEDPGAGEEDPGAGEEDPGAGEEEDPGLLELPDPEGLEDDRLQDSETESVEDVADGLRVFEPDTYFDINKELLKHSIAHHVSEAAMEDLVSILRKSGAFPTIRRFKAVKRASQRDTPKAMCSYEYVDTASGEARTVEESESVPARFFHDKVNYHLKYVLVFCEFAEVKAFHEETHGPCNEVTIHADDVPVNKSLGESFDIISVEFTGCNTIYPIRVLHARRSVAIDVQKNLREVLEEIAGANASVRALVADLPKRASLLGHVQHSGFYACHCCFIEGEYSSAKKAVFYPLDSQVDSRTHEGTVATVNHARFAESTATAEDVRANRHFLMGVKARSALLDVPGFDIVKHVPVDMMHAVDLGVTRRLFYLTFRVPGERNKTNNPRQDLTTFNVSYPKLKGPSEHTRHSRPHCRYWKASEYQALVWFHLPFLLTLLVDHPSPRKELLRAVWASLGYMVLHLNNSDINSDCEKYLKARSVFCKCHLAYFGRDCATMNDHLLLHLHEVKKEYRNLHSVSAIKAESMYQEFLCAFASGTLNVGKQAVKNLYLKYKEKHVCKQTLAIRVVETDRCLDNLVYTTGYCIYRVTRVEGSELRVVRGVCKPYVFHNVHAHLQLSDVGIFYKPLIFRGGEMPLPSNCVLGKVVSNNNYLVCVPKNVLLNGNK